MSRLSSRYEDLRVRTEGALSLHREAYDDFEQVAGRDGGRQSGKDDF